MRNTLVVSATAAALTLGLAAPAMAVPADSNDTTTTFTLTGGSLLITVPALADLGVGSTGSTVSGQLGVVQVTDARGTLTPTWTAVASSSAFTTGGAGSGESVAAANVQYWSGTATATTGNGTFTPGQATSAGAVDLSASRTAYSKSGGTGNNTAAWNPTLTVSAPLASVAGVYTGTITHSVS